VVEADHHQEFPDLVRMTRQYLTVPDTSVSPERFLSHHIPDPTLPTINLVDKRSLLIRSCW
jgi:hypothetical protein